MAGRTDRPPGGEIGDPVLASDSEREPGAASEAAGSPGSADVSLGRRLLNLRTLASFAVAAVVLTLLVTQVRIDLGLTVRAIRGADLGHYLLAFVVFYLVFPIRAVRWRQMLQNSGWRHEELPSVPQLAEIIYLSFFANCLVPAKLGDVYRAYLLRQRGRLAGSKAGGTIVAERLLDITTLLVLGGLAGLVILRGRTGALEALALPLAVLCGLVVAAALGLLTMRAWSPWLIRILPPRPSDLLARFQDGATRSLGAYHIIVPLSVATWLVESLRLYFVVRSLGVSLDPSPAAELAIVVAVALIGSLLTALPLTPAGLGFTESGVVGALVLLGAAGQDVALSIAFLDRTISYASIALLGLVVYLVSSRRSAGKRAGR